MPAYYNEIEPYAAQWLRNLIKAGHIADGEVDTRSIVDVRPADLAGFTQAHFFAGIGGWSHALRLAGWPDDRPIWTGSCPCQPFSVAGKGAGVDDPRHLWPHFFRLIGAVRPPVVMGEQVAGAAGYGWLDGVRADLEAEKYACRGVDIPACAVDAPHIRSRLYWVAEALDNAAGARRAGDARSEQVGAARDKARRAGFTGRSGDGCDLGDASNAGSQGRVLGRQDQERETEQRHLGRDGSAYGGSHMADADHERRDGVDALLRQDEAGRDAGDIHEAAGRRPAHSFWANAIWLTGADGKARRAQPGIPLLAHGIPNRVGKLRAYGNAIVPPLAAEVIGAYLDAEKTINLRLNKTK
jgi:DNA (cytosine-5)-methyltransferase 1